MIIDIEEDRVQLEVDGETNCCLVMWVDYPITVMFDSSQGDIMPDSWRSFRAHLEDLQGVYQKDVTNNE